MDFIKVLSPETDHKIGEAAVSITTFFSALTILVTNINTLLVDNVSAALAALKGTKP